MITTKIQIRWSDIDQLRHVYNGQYQHFFDIGKSDYFVGHLHIPHNWAETGKGFITVRTLNNYYSPACMHEPIVIETYPVKVGTKSFELFQRMINSETGELKSDSHSVMVCFNPLTNSTYEVPATLRSMLEADKCSRD